eukprot:GILK01017890.1.p1 GENE.GILK01017890.1~~GILK01017890.1.p1  ORF type:complete len:246 (+),score=28.84 GILK01017890.1:32-739(+)
MPPVAVFDMLGTFFSFERVQQKFAQVFHLPPSLVTFWFTQSVRDFMAFSTAGAYVPLKQVLCSSLTRVLRMHGVEVESYTTLQIDQVLDQFSQLTCHPDAGDCVSALTARGWRVFALTNGSEDNTLSALERAGLIQDFYAVLSTDSISKAKPDPATYDLVKQHVDAGDDLWFVSAHAWDIVGARQAGFKTVFVTTVEKEYMDVHERQPTEVVDSLLAASQLMISGYQGSRRSAEP